jgi:hypothetical protein
MKIKKLFLMLSIILLSFAGCSKYDDTALWDKINENAAQIAELKEWQATVNGHITALQNIVTALQNNDFVTGVTAFTSPSPGGYTVSFSKGSVATIWNGSKGDKGDTGADGQNGNDGKDGVDGLTPQIGVAQFPANSGDYYWTLNSDWLLDDSGSKIPVTGEKGETGQTGITPQLRINATDNYWEISFNNGTTWAYVLDSANNKVKATGPQGVAGQPGSNDAIFAPNGVDIHDDYIEFTLADLVTKFRLPRKFSVAYLNPASIVPYSGRIDTLVVKSLDVWRVSVNASWVTLSPTIGIGSSFISVTVASNTTYSARTATITFASEGITYAVAVNQEAYGSTTYSTYLTCELGSPSSAGTSTENGSTEESAISDAALFIYKLDGTPEAMAYVSNYTAADTDTKTV